MTPHAFFHLYTPFIGFPEDDDEDGDNDLSWSDDSSGDEMEQSNRVAHIPLTAVEEVGW